MIDEIGLIDITLSSNPFEALIESILFQQLAGSAALAILKRFKGIYGGRFPDAGEIQETPIDTLKSTGMSSRKIEYIKDVASRTLNDSLPLDQLAQLEDEDIIVKLDEIKGVGRWTAQMFLIFVLGRPDVLPTGDLGLKSAIQRIYKLNHLPQEEEVERIGKKWHPYCTIASLYLWRSHDTKQPI